MPTLISRPPGIQIMHTVRQFLQRIRNSPLPWPEMIAYHLNQQLGRRYIHADLLERDLHEVFIVFVKSSDLKNVEYIVNV